MTTEQPQRPESSTSLATVVDDFSSFGRTEPSISRHNDYLPTLDGWRAIAVLGVIFYHDKVRQVGLFNTAWVHAHGILGVDVFFAISGLLICSRLLQEEGRHGRISLKSFYTRRAFRILPPAVLYLVVLGLLGLTHIYPVQLGELLGSLFFYRGYTSILGTVPGSNVSFSAHFWSLSVEEHFYLLLPGMLLFIPRQFRIGSLALCAALVIVHRHLEGQHRSMDVLLHHSDIRLDALIVPAIYAVALALRSPGSTQRAWLRFSPLLALPLLRTADALGETPLKYTIAAVIMPLIIIGTVVNPHTWFSRLLELRPLRFIGRISYGLYLWQQLFFASRAGRESTPPFLFHTSWIVLTTATFACAVASYYLVERPMISFGRGLASHAPPPGNSTSR